MEYAKNGGMVILIQHLTYTYPPPRHPQLPCALVIDTGCPGISSTSPANEGEDINHEGAGSSMRSGRVGGISAEVTLNYVWAVSY